MTVMGYVVAFNMLLFFFTLQCDTLGHIYDPKQSVENIKIHFTTGEKPPNHPGNTNEGASSYGRSRFEFQLQGKNWIHPGRGPPGT